MIEQRHLHQILAIAEHGSFRKAAAALHMSQPALSKSIQNLEQYLSIQLLDRNVRPVRPTVYGRLFVERARLATSIVDDLSDQLSQLARLKKGMVRIGLARIAAQSLVEDAVATFAKRHPEIRLQVEKGIPAEMMSRFESLRLDVIIADEDVRKDSDWYQWLPLGEEPLLFIVRKDHPLLGGPPPSLPAVLEYPLIVPRPPRFTLDWADSLLDQTDGDQTLRQLPWIICDSFSVIQSVLLKTDHVTMGMAETFRGLLDDGRLVVLETSNKPLVWRPLMAYHSRQSLSPATEAFLRCLLESRGVTPPTQFVGTSPE